MVVDGSNKASDNDDDGTSGDRNEQVSPPPVVAALSFPDLSSWHILKTVVLDGCGDLELIAYNSMPLSLESFTLISNVATKIKSISFRGCAKLKSLLLRGLFYCLVELDISGTSIKTLDLSATQAKDLKRLFLLGCEELRAIQWPMQEPTEYRKVSLLETRYLPSANCFAECQKSGTRQRIALGKEFFAECRALGKKGSRQRTSLPSARLSAKARHSA